MNSTLSKLIEKKRLINILIFVYKFVLLYALLKSKIQLYETNWLPLPIA